MDISRPVGKEETGEEVLPKGKTSTQGSIVNDVPVPFTDYQTANLKPYPVDYFELGDLWDDPQGGFSEEVETINSYLKSKVEKGEIANTIKAAKYELNQLEKMNNLKHEERAVVKIGTLAAYIKFLTETDNLKTNLRKYGTER